MKKREKKLHLAKETILELQASKTDLALLRQVVGGSEEELEPCAGGGSSHFPHYCP
ncbi:MAG: hypothetical protein QOF89_580 [Acidobacteriota bacterium]|jgi:hypothetical protein|nr:hypothetical protein [Acidobacteriota bacterium]